ncbi:heme exporter protein CcmB [Gammaproteobacteria bacterium AH-315-M22]|nr:heme exporter protein CcmB [Gammaproteobacteria bacterium AH-315-M22]
MLAIFRTLLLRDLTLGLRNRADMLMTVFFFVIVVSLFPLAVGPDADLLRIMGPGVIWVAALLASLLSLERLFGGDYADGTLEQMVISHHPLPVIVFAKVVAHWLIAGLPLVIISPLLALQYGLDGQSTLLMMATLLIGTPTLSLLGAVGAALTLGLRGGGVLISLLVLPLFIPVLIFGAAVVGDASAGLPVEAHFSLLGAMLVLALILSPWTIASALRISIE